jgi:nucleotide-binding universal stress UspA family protein
MPRVVFTESKPVVVGVDGSTASINALRWAVAEAAIRDVPIRLVHAVSHVSPLTAPVACCGDEVLLGAEDEVSDRGSTLRVESVRVPGKAGEVLLRESRNALMICVGARSQVRSAGTLFGATQRCSRHRRTAPLQSSEPQWTVRCARAAWSPSFSTMNLTTTL